MNNEIPIGLSLRRAFLGEIGADFRTYSSGYGKRRPKVEKELKHRCGAGHSVRGTSAVERARTEERTRSAPP